jgi:peptide/nickel transport system permease protein
MATYLAQRIFQTMLILLGIAAITFLLLYMVPADPAVQIAGRSATAQTVANIRRELGLDQPLLAQFLRYLGGLLHGDLGRSYAQKTDVMTLILSRLPATITLMIAGIAAELAIGVSLGVIAAVRRNSFLDRAVMIASFTTISAPQFLVALLLLYVFAATLGWFPMSGFGSPAHVVLPALTLGILGAGWYARIVRSTMIDVLNQDYVRTAKAKGVAPVRVVLRHALPNALLPVIAMIGIDIGQFMAGLVVVEAVFGWPGIGQLAWQAIQQVDIPIIMGVTLVSALAIVLGNLLADLIAPFIDPRIRLR